MYGRAKSRGEKFQFALNQYNKIRFEMHQVGCFENQNKDIYETVLFFKKGGYVAKLIQSDYITTLVDPQDIHRVEWTTAVTGCDLIYDVVEVD